MDNMERGIGVRKVMKGIYRHDSYHLRTNERYFFFYLLKRKIIKDYRTLEREAQNLERG